MAVVDEENVFTRKRIKELGAHFFAWLPDHPVANLVDVCARDWVDRDNRCTQSVVFDGLSSKHRGVARSHFHIPAGVVERQLPVQGYGIKPWNPAVDPSWR